MLDKLYIAVLDEVPDHMVPVLVAHSVLGAHLDALGTLSYECMYRKWLRESFRKCVLRVNRKEFEKIKLIPLTYLGHENTVLNGEKSCAIVYPTYEEVPNVLKFAKMWKPKDWNATALKQLEEVKRLENLFASKSWKID